MERRCLREPRQVGRRFLLQQELSATLQAARAHTLRRGSRHADRCCYLPREVFFGRLALVGVVFSVWASDFGRFFPATSGSFPCPSVAHPSEID
jgi:hypothetical protein